MIFLVCVTVCKLPCRGIIFFKSEDDSSMGEGLLRYIFSYNKCLIGK